MPYVNIDAPSIRAENTVINYISNSFSTFYTNSLYFYTGIDNGDKLAPAIIVTCNNAQETYFQTRVYSFDVDVSVKDIAYDSTTSSYNSLVGNIFSLFGDSKTSSLSMNVSNSNMCVFQTQMINFTNSQLEDSWGCSISLRLVGALL